jgi:hypothetical protein
MTIFIVADMLIVKWSEKKFKENATWAITLYVEKTKEANKEIFMSILKDRPYRPRRQDFNNHASAWRKKGEKDWKRTGREDKKLDEFFEQKLVDAKVEEQEFGDKMSDIILNK